MATSAQVIVEAGYAKSTRSDPGKMANDGELLGRLNRVYLPIYTLAARQRPEQFGSTATMVLAGTPGTLAFSAATPALTDVIEIRAVYGVSGTVAAGVKIHLVPETEVRRTWQIPPTVFQRGNSIVSRGSAGDPVATDTIGLTLLDTPTALTTLAINIDARFPQRYHEMLVNTVGLYLIGKDGGDASRIQAIQADQRFLMGAFAQDFGISPSAIEAILTDRIPALQAAG